MMSARTSALLIAIATAALDRATKLWIERTVATWETVVVVPGFFRIIHTRNPGIVFGVFSESEGALRTVAVSLVAAAVLVAVFVYFWRLPEPLPAPQKYTRVALALILGGAAGNLYDRLLQGAVTDFLDFHLAGYHWPAFNLADAAITIGAGLLLLDLFVARRAEPPSGR